MYLNITDVCLNNHSSLHSLLHFACTRHYNASAGLKASGKWSKNRSILFLYHRSPSLSLFALPAPTLIASFPDEIAPDRLTANRSTERQLHPTAARILVHRSQAAITPRYRSRISVPEPRRKGEEVFLPLVCIISTHAPSIAAVCGRLGWTRLVHACRTKRNYT